MIAVIDRYTDNFGKALDDIARDESASSMSMLEHYVAPYAAFARTPDRVCLCGALSGEILALPRELRERVSLFFKAHQRWLSQILKRGAARGEFKLAGVPPKRQPGLSSAHCRARFWSSGRPGIPRN